MTDSGNRRLYGQEGIGACRRALSKQGCLAVWSAEPSKKFEQRLMAGGFNVRRFRVPAYQGSQSQSRFVWVAAMDPARLPPRRRRAAPAGKTNTGKRPQAFPKETVTGFFSDNGRHRPGPQFRSD